MMAHESMETRWERRTIVVPATYDEFQDDAFCPICGTRLTEAVNPLSVPTAFLDIGIEVDPMPTFGWQCNCRRATITVIAPAELAPSTGTPVDLTVDGDMTTIAVRESALEATRPHDA